MLKRLDLRGMPHGDFASSLPRPRLDGAEPIEAVREIVESVRAGGDAALRQYADRFDGGAPADFRVDPAEAARAWERLDPQLCEALRFAHRRIESFHQSQRHDPVSHADDGIVIKQYQQPVSRAGCYVPGGLAAYPSTVLMTAVPARVAGVDEVVLCVPPAAQARIADVTLGAAWLAGVDEIYAVGGAQAIAAMAFGTESIPAVDVIAGPGNVYVALAKREVAGHVGVAAAFAGPSEVVVVADNTVPTAFVAIDLVVQAEHGPGGLGWLVTWQDEVVADVCQEVQRLTADSPRRDEITATLSRNGYAVLVDGPAEAIEVSNLIAPEHLQLMVQRPGDWLGAVRNAGAVFCGAMSPASVGDYVAGPSHVLPTNGTARFAGALTVDDFCKDMHVITLDQAALDGVADAVTTLADAEGLAAHGLSVRMRKSAQ